MHEKCMQYKLCKKLLVLVIIYAALIVYNELFRNELINEDEEINIMINNEYNLLSVSPSEYVTDKWTEDISLNAFLFSKTLQKLIDEAIYFIKKNKNKENKIYYLDIGSGPATITNLIAQYFDYFMTIEPNTLYYNNYKQHIFKHVNNTYLGNINKFVQNIDINEDFKNIQFNLITIIHTFYYIEINHYQTVLNKLYKLLSDNGGKLIISMAPKYKDTISDWSKIMYQFIGNYFDSLSMILSICSNFDGVQIEIFDEDASYDITYPSIDDAIHNILWNLMEELSFSRRYHPSLQNKTIAIKILRSYLQQNCMKHTNGECLVTASVGHIVITKSTEL